MSGKTETSHPLNSGLPCAQAALVASLRDPSPVVQEAALRALTPWAQRPPVREALLALKAGAGAHLGYAIDEALSAAGGAR